MKLLHEAGSDWAFYNGGNRWTYGVYMYKAAKQYGMKFRLSWHWNAVGRRPVLRPGLPRGRLRLVQLQPEGELIPSVQFERLREGLGDYRRMLTLARLAREHAGSAAATEAEKLLAEILGGFELGDRELKGDEAYAEVRRRLDAAIEKLR